MWPNFDGKPYGRDELAAHIDACDFSKWQHKDGSHSRPLFITLHNTSVPDDRLWLSWSAEKRRQYIRNMQPYYEKMGWRGGPHFFVPPDADGDVVEAFGFNDLMRAGTHASCFNDGSIGIEMVGEFSREPFDSGPGATVRDKAVRLMALLHNRIGLTPEPYAYNRSGIHFHVECRHDNHDCPGHFVHKADIVARVIAEMARLKGEPAPHITTPTPPLPLPAASIEAQAVGLAGVSDLIGVNWRNRGRAPAGYIKGMAAVFARVCQKLKAGDSTAIATAKAATGDQGHDVLAWYVDAFSALHMRNDVDGPDTLRHLFVLLTGLGMRESSGHYCVGRDRSTNNVTADTAEAGLFQMSWNAHTASPRISDLFHDYQGDVDGLLSIFKEGVVAHDRDLENYGTGDGAKFQMLCKTKPAFAAEATAIGLRVLRSHWGPIIRHEAELRPEADRLFAQIQKIVFP